MIIELRKKKQRHSGLLEYESKYFIEEFNDLFGISDQNEKILLEVLHTTPDILKVLPDAIMLDQEEEKPE